MRVYVAKTMAWVILGLVVTMGLLGVVVGLGWMALGDNGGGDFGPYCGRLWFTLLCIVGPDFLRYCDSG